MDADKEINNKELQKEQGQEEKGNSYKKSNKGKRQRNKGRDKGRMNCKRNDWTWYAYSEQIAKDIASLPYNKLPGYSWQFSGRQVSHSTIPTLFTSNTFNQCVMTIDYVPSIGIATKKVDGINMAAQQLYSFVRHANSGSKVYEAPDLMMYILAMRDIYTSWLELKRIIGLSQLFSFENKNLPDLLISAHGVDPIDLRSNLANYRARLNTLAKKINSFAVPKYFKAFDRGDFVSSNVFADSSSIRGQFYFYRKTGYYLWTPTTSESGSSLTYKSNQYTLPLRFAGLEQQINAMLADEDAGIMSGDILKAFGDGNLYALTEISGDYIVNPVFSEDALAQIENSRSLTVTTLASDADFAVTQSNGLIVFQPTWSLSSTDGQYYIIYSDILNSHKDNPDFRDNLDWTRAITIDEIVTDGDGHSSMQVESCGLELVYNYRLWNWTTASGSMVATNSTFRNVVYTTPGGTVYANELAKLSQFDWHPFVYVIYKVTTGSSTTYDIEPFGDIKVATPLSRETIQNLHDSANGAAFYAESLYKVAKKY